MTSAYQEKFLHYFIKQYYYNFLRAAFKRTQGALRLIKSYSNTKLSLNSKWWSQFNSVQEMKQVQLSFDERCIVIHHFALRPWYSWKYHVLSSQLLPRIKDDVTSTTTFMPSTKLATLDSYRFQ